MRDVGTARYSSISWPSAGCDDCCCCCCTCSGCANGFLLWSGAPVFCAARRPYSVAKNLRTNASVSASPPSRKPRHTPELPGVSERIHTISGIVRKQVRETRMLAFSSKPPWRLRPGGEWLQERAGRRRCCALPLAVALCIPIELRPWASIVSSGKVERNGLGGGRALWEERGRLGRYRRRGRCEEGVVGPKGRLLGNKGLRLRLESSLERQELLILRCSLLRGEELLLACPFGLLAQVLGLHCLLLRLLEVGVVRGELGLNGGKLRLY